MSQVGLKAYLLWEGNGRPDGGDFSEQARAELRAELRAGKSLQEVEQAMRVVRGSCHHESSVTPATLRSVNVAPPALCALQPPAEEAQQEQEQPSPPTPEPEPEPQQQPPETQQEQQQAEGAELGMGAGLRQRDVMDLIKVGPLNALPAGHGHH